MIVLPQAECKGVLDPDGVHGARIYTWQSTGRDVYINPAQVTFIEPPAYGGKRHEVCTIHFVGAFEGDDAGPLLGGGYLSVWLSTFLVAKALGYQA